MASNARLMRMSLDTQQRALAEYQQMKEPVTWYRSVWYKTLDSWNRFRRVVAKVAYGPEGNKTSALSSPPEERGSFLPACSTLNSTANGERWRIASRSSNSNCERDRTSTHTFGGQSAAVVVFFPYT